MAGDAPTRLVLALTAPDGRPGGWPDVRFGPRARRLSDGLTRAQRGRTVVPTWSRPPSAGWTSSSSPTRSLGFPWAVLQKFGNDQAGSKAALLAYYGLFALFPLLLLFTTILGYVLHGNERLRQDLVDSASAPSRSSAPSSSRKPTPWKEAGRPPPSAPFCSSTAPSGSVRRLRAP